MVDWAMHEAHQLAVDPEPETPWLMCAAFNCCVGIGRELGGCHFSSPPSFTCDDIQHIRWEMLNNVQEDIEFL